MGLRIWLLGISCLVALMRLAASFYDNLNQFPASQKEGHEFKMRSQLHNQCIGFWRDTSNFVKVALIAGICSLPLQIWRFQCWSNLNYTKQSICLSFTLVLVFSVNGMPKALFKKCRRMCLGYKKAIERDIVHLIVATSFSLRSIVNFEFYSPWS